jgi:hypothetical protein
MTREKAYKLLSEVADAGYSCQLNVGIHAGMSPGEHCSVHVHQLGHFDAIKLQALMDIGELFDVELHLIGQDLRYVERSKPLPVVTKR